MIGKDSFLQELYERLMQLIFKAQLSPTEVIADIVRRSCPSDRDMNGWLETLGNKIQEMETPSEKQTLQHMLDKVSAGEIDLADVAKAIQSGKVDCPAGKSIYMSSKK